MSIAARMIALFRGPIVSQYLVVAGGGGAGGVATGSLGAAGGGGAGGLLAGTGLLIGSPQAITVGAPGIGGGANVDGTDGGNSSIGALKVAIGGGGGGAPTHSGRNGGSGGGGGNDDPGGGSNPGGSPTAGQGNAGGTGLEAPSGGDSGSGGGAGGAGSTGGPGGAGLSNSITGTSIEYARGGQADGTSTQYTGPGSGGRSAEAGVDGIAGIVVIRYPGPPKATGGTIDTTSVPGSTIHIFTSNGTFTPT